MNQKQLSIQGLREDASRLFDYLEEQGCDLVALKGDYYWSIAPGERYSMDSSPSELTFGQSSEDLAWLSGIVEGDREPVGYALV